MQAVNSSEVPHSTTWCDLEDMALSENPVVTNGFEGPGLGTSAVMANRDGISSDGMECSRSH